MDATRPSIAQPLSARVYFFPQDPDIRKVAIPIIIVEPIPYHENVINIETHKIGRDIRRGLARLPQQYTSPNRLGPPPCQPFSHLPQCSAGIENIINQ